MNISVGILAWNEEDSIAKTIESLLAQSLFDQGGGGLGPVEVICVANGCSDGTAERAREAFAAHCPVGGGVRARVEEVAERGKENAWNRFVHDFSAREAGYLVLMDGDVRIGHRRTLENLVAALERDARAHLAGARTIKHVALKEKKSLRDRVAVAAGGLRRAKPGVFAGALYCARASVLRRFALPLVLMGEDAFVHAMVTTDGFSHASDPTLVAQPEDATVIFDAYMRLPQVHTNLRRRAVELTINAVLYTEFWRVNRETGEDAGSLILRRNREDPGWDERLVREAIRSRGRWVIPRRIMTRHLRLLHFHSVPKRVLMFPVAVAGFLLNAVAAVSANSALRKGRIRTLWVGK
jgi:glycosyltransferase involved in cell wall biosynthesis